MKNLLVNTLVEVIGDSTYKHTLCQCRDFTRRNERIQLGIEGMAHILTIDRD